MRHFSALVRLSCLLGFSALVGCSPAVQEYVALEVGTEKVTLREYEHFFEKNSGSSDAAKKASQEDRDRFLELFTNYKLKLQDAYAHDLPNDPDVQKELREYRASVASTYLVDRELTEPALRALYERKKEELRPAHILIRINPQDSTGAYNHAVDIINQLKQGKDFGTLAEQYSDDPSVHRNHGDLSYITAGQTVPPFENAVYRLRVGEFTTKPVRSAYGYHIIKLLDRKPTVYSMKLSHIMVREQGKEKDSSRVDSAMIRVKALQDSLRAGGNFERLAEKYSEDPGSAARGGSLGSFQRRSLPPEFEDAAFRLNVGEVSDIVHTKYGYHIIRCDDIRPLPSFDEMRAELLKLYQRSSYQEDYRKFVDSLRARHDVLVHADVLSRLIPLVDSTKSPYDSLWAADVPADVRGMALISVGKGNVSVDSVITILSNWPDYRDASLTPSDFPLQVDRVTDQLTLEAASMNLEDRYPEFKTLMKEFRDGVLLYKAEQEEVWNNIAITPEKLQALYAERREQYRLPDRVEFVEMACGSDAVAKAILRDVKRGKNLDTVVARSKTKVTKTTRGLLTVGTDTLSHLAWNSSLGSLIGPVRYNNQWYLLKVVAKDPARFKTIDEVSAELSTVLQDEESKRLMNAWLEHLRQRFPVIVHRDIIAKAFAGEGSGS